MIRLSTSNGLVLLTLAAPAKANGKPGMDTDYEVEVVLRVPPAWECRLSKDDKQYRVIFDDIWYCNCPAYQFSAGVPCKHIRAATELKAILQGIRKQPLALSGSAG